MDGLLAEARRHGRYHAQVHGRLVDRESAHDVHEHVHATVPDAPSLDIADRMTLEAWVRPTISSGWRTVMLKELGIGTVRLMTNNPEKIAALAKAGLAVISDHRVLGRLTTENVS